MPPSWNHLLAMEMTKPSLMSHFLSVKNKMWNRKTKMYIQNSEVKKWLEPKEFPRPSLCMGNSRPSSRLLT